jgi:predicted RNA-binding Zn ribbon-like protein
MRSYKTEPLELIGGALSVDFVNTVTWRGDPFDSGERLTDYEEFAYWATGSGAMEPESRDFLIKVAAERPVESAKALSDAIALRESIARLFDHKDGGATAADLAVINRILRNIPATEQITHSSDGGYQRTVAMDRNADILRLPLYRIACSAAEIATSDTITQISSCANERCRWMFIDTSKSRRRRWCNMKTCGNRAKVREFYARHQEAASEH